MVKKRKRKLPRKRAIELFHPDTPFRPKVVKSKKTYRRNPRHKGNDDIR